jgi:hypothetical protein
MIQLLITTVLVLLTPFLWMAFAWTITLKKMPTLYMARINSMMPVPEWTNVNDEFKKHLAVEKSKVDLIAAMSEVTHKDWQPNIGMVSYMKGTTRINIYTTVMTVAIAERGKKQRYIYNVTEDLLKEIFATPQLF